MTDIEKLKFDMYPYYQDTDSEEILTDLLAEYVSVEKSASILWGMSATRIWSGNIKAFGTGAESTTFQSLSDVIKFCKAQSDLFAEMDASKKNIGSIMCLVTPIRFAGGADDSEYYG